jgi:hypothetical protein
LADQRDFGRSHGYQPRDFALRLVGKFRIDDTTDFWGKSGQRPLSQDVLMPQDAISRIVENIRVKYRKPFVEKLPVI